MNKIEFANGFTTSATDMSVVISTGRGNTDRAQVDSVEKVDASKAEEKPAAEDKPVVTETKPEVKVVAKTAKTTAKKAPTA